MSLVEDREATGIAAMLIRYGADVDGATGLRSEYRRDVGFCIGQQ